METPVHSFRARTNVSWIIHTGSSSMREGFGVPQLAQGDVGAY
jgi:hypothetical protein